MVELLLLRRENPGTWLRRPLLSRCLFLSRFLAGSVLPHPCPSLGGGAGCGM